MASHCYVDSKGNLTAYFPLSNNSSNIHETQSNSDVLLPVANSDGRGELIISDIFGPFSLRDANVVDCFKQWLLSLKKNMNINSMLMCLVKI